MCGCERASSAAPGPQRLTLAAPLCPAEPLRSTSPTLSFAPLRPADQGMYRAIVQHGPFSDDGTADRFDISAPASVFVDDGAGGGGAGDACAVCLLPAGSAAEGGAAAASPPFRFARRVDESFTNGWRELAAADGRLLGGDLVFCDHPLHTPCAKAYAQNLILKQGRCARRGAGGSKGSGGWGGGRAGRAAIKDEGFSSTLAHPLLQPPTAQRARALPGARLPAHDGRRRR